jgi:hypothetical protein
MEPLSGNAEQISARTMAVMTMKMIVMMKDDLPEVPGSMSAKDIK